MRTVRATSPFTGRLAYAHLYGTRWRKARFAFLCAHPWCVMCKADGKVEPATVVDHIIPHKGDERLFWDRSNWSGLCRLHHDSTKARQEASGHAPGHDTTGLPTDPRHPWARSVRAARGAISGVVAALVISGHALAYDDNRHGTESGPCACGGFHGVIAGNVDKMLSPGGFSHNEPGGTSSASDSFAGDHGMLGHI